VAPQAVETSELAILDAPDELLPPLKARCSAVGFFILCLCLCHVTNLDARCVSEEGTALRPSSTFRTLQVSGASSRIAQVPLLSSKDPRGLPECDRYAEVPYSSNINVTFPVPEPGRTMNTEPSQIKITRSAGCDAFRVHDEDLKIQEVAENFVGGGMLAKPCPSTGFVRKPE